LHGILSLKLGYGYALIVHSSRSTLSKWSKWVVNWALVSYAYKSFLDHMSTIVFSSKHGPKVKGI